jgi:hypothetical protein
MQAPYLGQPPPRADCGMQMRHAASGKVRAGPSGLDELITGSAFGETGLELVHVRQRRQRPGRRERDRVEAHLRG